ncbi:MAG: tyrosine-protein phosphatase [Actinobacteria bacterium]|nr:tyrosine-protein phosphatase [Actinomycetota bacterium]
MADRNLSWSGTYNSRDLGGLAAAAGLTRRGAIVRSDSLQRLHGRGWEEVEALGVRTVVDLRNESEIGPDLAPRPDSIETVNIPLDVSEDREFWDVWENGPEFATPLYYRPHLERFPERSAEVIRAIALAPPGGVVFHCQGGRDRAGQVAMLVLALAGVEPGEIAADYALSDERLRSFYLAQGEEDEGPKIAAFLRERGTTASELIVELLTGFDLEAALLVAGLEERDLEALRRRLLP